MDLRDVILDVFQALGIILVFVSLLFSMKYPVIVNALEEECPEGPKAKLAFNKRLKSCIVTDCLPVFILTLLSFYVMLPITVELLILREISFWSLDIMPFAYVVINMLMFIILVWVVLLSSKLLIKIRRTR